MTDPLPPVEPLDARRATDMDEASSLIDAVFRLERAVTRIGNARLRPWGMTLSSYTALRILARQPHLTLAQLARRCYARPQTMTRMVTQLESRGLVERSAHPESERALSLRVTDEGLAALREMGVEVLKVSDTLNSLLDREAIAATDRQLRQAAQVVEKEVKEMGQTAG
ncbi:MarR family winged helix-turn-helix transcriptional regulator [Streptomyces tremellae]|uniref:MarR family winged helix-turn-helix transcriptional regulator n=1 Tax=Streptomyces tremellae TaxID=1124239 RepID=UPI0031E5EC16